MSEVAEVGAGLFQVLERAATNPEVDVEKMERIYQMLERAEDRQAAQAFNADLVRAQAAAQPVYKSKWNPQTSSWYADIAVVCEAINKVFTDHNFSLSFSEGETAKPEHIRVLCDMRHARGHSEQRHIDMPVVTTGIKGNTMMTATHGTAGAFTYGRRYLIVLIANLPTPDNDGNAPPKKGPITEEQALTVHAYIDEHKLDRPKFEAWIKQKGVEAIENIPNDGSYDTVMRFLKKMPHGN